MSPMIQTLDKFDSHFRRINEHVNNVVLVDRDLMRVFDDFCMEHGDPSSMEPGQAITWESPCPPYFLTYIYNYCKRKGVVVRLYCKKLPFSPKPPVYMVRCFGRWEPSK